MRGERAAGRSPAAQSTVGEKRKKIRSAGSQQSSNESPTSGAKSKPIKWHREEESHEPAAWNQSSSASPVNCTRRLGSSFKRQLLARFAGADRPGRAPTNLAKCNSVSGSGGGLVGRLNHVFRRDLRAARSSARSARRASDSSLGAELGSPKHLIRMFAERGPTSGGSSVETNSTESTGLSLRQLLIETPTRAASCLRPRLAGESLRSQGWTPVASPRRQPAADRPTGTKCAMRNRLVRSNNLGDNQKRPAAAHYSDQVSRLIASLNELSGERGEGAKRACPQHQQSEQAGGLDELLRLDNSWTDFVRLEPPAPLADDLRQQQDAIWELLSTEVSHIRRLTLVVELFSATLARLQRQHGLLCELELAALTSNIDQVRLANLNLWLNYFRPALEWARSRRAPIEPTDFAGAFIEISHLFRPYYRYCCEQSACIDYIRQQRDSSDCFKVYLAWCESQKECERLRLTDLLAQPMQRLTRYSLLLKTIAKRSPRADARQRLLLRQMIVHMDKFVAVVDLELKRQLEFQRLLDVSRRIKAFEMVGLENFNSETQQLLRQLYLGQLDLTRPLFDCPHACRRQLLFESASAAGPPATSSSTLSQQLGQLRFKDQHTSSKLDVVLLLFTDQLFICKPANCDKQQPQSQQQQFEAGAPNQPERHHHSQFFGSSLARADRLRNAHSPTSHEHFPASLIGLIGDRRQQQQQERSPGSKWAPRKRAASHSFGQGRPGAAASFGVDPGGLSSKHELQLSDSLLADESRAGRRELAAPGADGRLSINRQTSEQVLCSATCGRGYQPLSCSPTPTNCSSSKASLAGPCQPEQRARQLHLEQLATPSSCLEAHVANTRLGSDQSTSAADIDLLTTAGDARPPRQPTPGPASVTRQRACLRSIRGPFPIDRLVMHELADGAAVLFNQLNDLNTVAASFVVYCSVKQVPAQCSERPAASFEDDDKRRPGDPDEDSPASSLDKCPTLNETDQQRDGGRPASPARNLPTAAAARSCSDLVDPSPARPQFATCSGAKCFASSASRLIDLVRQAQVRHKMIAQFHDAKVVDFEQPSPAARDKPAKLPVFLMHRQHSQVRSVAPEQSHTTRRLTKRSSGSSGSFNETRPDELVGGQPKFSPGQLAVELRHLRSAMEQHQLLLLNHGERDKLARNNFTYTISDEDFARYFAISAEPLMGASQTGPRQRLAAQCPDQESCHSAQSDEDELLSVSWNSVASQTSIARLDTRPIPAADTRVCSLPATPRRPARPQITRSIRVQNSLIENKCDSSRTGHANEDTAGGVAARKSAGQLDTSESGAGPGRAGPSPSSSADGHRERRQKLHCIRTSSSGSNWELFEWDSGSNPVSSDAASNRSLPSQEAANSRRPASRRLLFNSLRRQKVLQSQPSDQTTLLNVHSASHRGKRSPRRLEPLDPGQHADQLSSVSSVASDPADWNEARLSGEPNRRDSVGSLSRNLTSTFDQITVDESICGNLPGHTDGHLEPRRAGEPRARSFELGSLNSARKLCATDSRLLATSIRSTSAELVPQISLTLTAPSQANVRASERTAMAAAAAAAASRGESPDSRVANQEENSSMIVAKKDANLRSTDNHLLLAARAKACQRVACRRKNLHRCSSCPPAAATSPVQPNHRVDTSTNRRPALEKQNRMDSRRQVRSRFGSLSPGLTGAHRWTLRQLRRKISQGELAARLPANLGLSMGQVGGRIQDLVCAFSNWMNKLD